MIRKNGRNQRSSRFEFEPTPDSIKAECARVRAERIIENSERCRIDSAERTYKAHLRFIQFLIEKAEA